MKEASRAARRIKQGMSVSIASHGKSGDDPSNNAIGSVTSILQTPYMMRKDSTIVSRYVRNRAYDHALTMERIRIGDVAYDDLCVV